MTDETTEEGWIRSRTRGERDGTVVLHEVMRADDARWLAAEIVGSQPALAARLRAAAEYAASPPPAWTAVYQYDGEYGLTDEFEDVCDTREAALEVLRRGESPSSDLVPVALVDPDERIIEGEALQRLLHPPMLGPERPPEPGVCVQVQHHHVEVPPPPDVVMDARWQGVRLKPKRYGPGARVLTNASTAAYLEARGLAVRWWPPAGDGVVCGALGVWTMDARGPIGVETSCGRPPHDDRRHAAYDGDMVLAVWS